jgi:TPR repeat protein
MTNIFKLSPLVFSLLIGACTNKENTATPSLPEVNATRVDLAFTCTHEAAHLPPLDANADALFQYARYLQKADGPKDFDAIARYYRIAAAYGNYKANHNAQLLISQGLADSPDGPKESVDLAMQLVEQGIPGGYFDIGHYLETGYGLKQDPALALRYFRKAADLGSPEAQAYVAEQLVPHDKAPEIARQMRECAMNQGYANAATSLGINQKNMAHYPEAIAAFQKGTMAGDTLSALSLENAFKGVPPSDRLSYLGLAADAERSRRYKLIGKFIDSHDGQNPKVPDIDKIAPLPPAKLPEWDGTFQWDNEQAAKVEPQAPSEALVEQLAQAKRLDPATGLPLAH